jgi:hypothetical protein
MQFVQFGRQDGHGVRAQVGRQIADAQALVAVAVAVGERGGVGQHFSLTKRRGSGQLFGRIIGQAEHGQRRGACTHLRFAHAGYGLVDGPVALLLRRNTQWVITWAGRIDAQAAPAWLRLREIHLDFEQTAQIVEGLDRQRRLLLHVDLDAPPGWRATCQCFGRRPPFQQGAQIEAASTNVGFRPIDWRQAASAPAPSFSPTSAARLNQAAYACGVRAWCLSQCGTALPPPDAGRLARAWRLHQTVR